MMEERINVLRKQLRRAIEYANSAEKLLQEFGDKWNYYSDTRDQMRLEIIRSEMKGALSVSISFDKALLDLLHYDIELQDFWKRVAVYLTMSVTQTVEALIWMKDNPNINDYLYKQRIAMLLRQVHGVLSDRRCRYIPTDGLALAVARGESFVIQSGDKELARVSVMLERIRTTITIHP